MVRGSLFGAILLAVGCSAFDAQLDPLRYQGGALDGQVEGDGSTPLHMDAALPDSGLRDAGMDAAQDAAQDGTVTDADLDAGGDGGGDADVDAGCGNGPGQTDCCLSDPAKAAPGVCGCGVSDADSDSDATPDCVDACPADANKTAPGVCGCGLADEDSSAATCSDLLDALVHRYPFDGAGNTINDVHGSATGVLVGSGLPNNGTCTLAGGTTGEYVDLPNGIVSALTNATIEVWVAWNGTGNWARIFDFGDTTSMPEGSQGTGSTMLFLTPRPSGGSTMRLVYSLTGSTGQTVLDGTGVLPSDGVHHVAAVIDDTGNMMRLYLDGELEGSVAFNGMLSGINDVNNWLGRSQYDADADFGGALHEARIYNAALTDEQIAFSFAQGPDPAFLE